MRRFLLLATVLASFAFLFSVTSCDNGSGGSGTFETFSETHDYKDDKVNKVLSVTSSDTSVVEIEHTAPSTEVKFIYKSTGTSIVTVKTDSILTDEKQKYTVKANKTVVKTIAF